MHEVEGDEDGGRCRSARERGMEREEVADAGLRLFQAR
jgi:hypothetical protein